MTDGAFVHCPCGALYDREEYATCPNCMGTGVPNRYRYTDPNDLEDPEE